MEWPKFGQNTAPPSMHLTAECRLYVKMYQKFVTISKSYRPIISRAFFCNGKSMRNDTSVCTIAIYHNIDMYSMSVKEKKDKQKKNNAANCQHNNYTAGRFIIKLPHHMRQTYCIQPLIGISLLPFCNYLFAATPSTPEYGVFT